MKGGRRTVDKRRIKMSWLQTIERDGNLLTMNIQEEVFWMAMKNAIGSIIRRIERFADGIMANKNVSARRKIGRYM